MRPENPPVEKAFPVPCDRECWRLRGRDLQQKRQRSDRQRNPGEGCVGAV